MKDDESEFMLADVLLGDVIEMDRDMDASVSPFEAGGEMRSLCEWLNVPPSIAGCKLREDTDASDAIDRCAAPPAKSDQPSVWHQVKTTGLRYNTVQFYTQTDIKNDGGAVLGHHDDRVPETGQNIDWSKNEACPVSTVWVVYENCRAYPTYLVRYYRGEYDPARCKFATREEAGATETTEPEPEPEPEPNA
jgi:hypothetical protein